MPRRYRALRGLLPVLVLLMLCPALRADAIVNSSLSLTQLQIIPTTGTLNILPGFNTIAFSSVYDSLGGLSQQYDSEFDSPASASSATTLASADAAASAPDLTSSASSAVDIPDIAASAGTNVGAEYGALSGYFEIADSTGDANPVNVTMNAFLSASQSLFADPSDLAATSEVTFNLFLYDPLGNLVTSLFLDNPLAIPPGSSLSDSSTPGLTTGTLDLLTNSDYYLYAETDAESFAAESTPEPSYGALSGALVSLLIISFAPDAEISGS